MLTACRGVNTDRCFGGWQLASAQTAPSWRPLSGRTARRRAFLNRQAFLSKGTGLQRG